MFGIVFTLIVNYLWNSVLATNVDTSLAWSMGRRYAVVATHSLSLSLFILLDMLQPLLLLLCQSAGSRLAGTFQIKTAIVRARLDRPFICIQSCSEQRRNPTDGSSSSSNNNVAATGGSANIAQQCAMSVLLVLKCATLISARGMWGMRHEMPFFNDKLAKGTSWHWTNGVNGTAACG